MKPLRILITNNTLSRRAGSELYVRDLAIALLRRGHSPVAYSTTLGEVADELRGATVPIIDDLNRLEIPPDLIHGHHHLETMIALLRFPGVPAISFCHGWLPWQEAPPRFPRILRYVAVDETCRDRLVLENGVPESRVRLLLNFVDLQRFRPRGLLPRTPSRALAFSNSLSEQEGLVTVREACARTGLRLDVFGLAAGNPCSSPESILGQYDVVFAKARCALEALAVGCTVVLCDAGRSGPMVTSANLARLRRQNFGIRAMGEPLTPDGLIREIRRYDKDDAAAVSQAIRKTAGLDDAVDNLVALYEEVLGERAEMDRANVWGELWAAGEYLQEWAPLFKGFIAAWHRVLNSEDRGIPQARIGHLQDQVDLLQADLDHQQAEINHRQAKLEQQQVHVARLHGQNHCLQAELAGLHGQNHRLQAELAALHGQNHCLQAELAALHGSLTWRLGQLLFRIPVAKTLVGPIARELARRFARRPKPTL